MVRTTSNTKPMFLVGFRDYGGGRVRRMSIRQFKPEPVPKEILMEIIDIAKWSPSYKNSQPWESVLNEPIRMNS